jgi:hypothetical protein
MGNPRERHVPTRYIDTLFSSEQPVDDVPTVDGNSPEAGGPSVRSMGKKDILAFLKKDRSPKTTPPAQILVEIEGKLFSSTELIVPKKGQPPEIVHDTRRGRQVLTITSNRSGQLEKRNVRKLPPQASPQDVDHISVQEALRRYEQDQVRGGLPTEKTLQQGARLTHETKPWEHRKRSDQGGWFSTKEQKRTGKKNTGKSTP